MSSVPSGVKKCVAALKGAKSDTEKFAALFMVTKLVKGKECDANSKKLIFEAIGFAFLKRLLMCPDVPADCPPQVYKSVAMSVLSALCREKEVATHADILSNASVLLDIVQQADNESYEDNLIVINEAYECLQSIANYEEGQNALFQIGAVVKLSDIYSRNSFQTDEALNVLVSLTVRFGTHSWGDNLRPFHTLMNVLALDFETDHSERKFKLCAVLEALIFSAPKTHIVDSYSEEQWPVSVYKGLHDILTSKVGKAQRDPALKLAAQMMCLLGAEWAIVDEDKPRQFFLLLIQLASVEVRMQLEDKSLADILKNAHVVTACFLLLEVSITFMNSDMLELEQIEKQHVYTALKGAFSAVLSTLKSVSDKNASLNAEERLLIFAMIRALAAWLAQDTTVLRDAIYAVLPYVLTIANDSFYNFRTQHVTEKVKSCNLDAEKSSPATVPVVAVSSCIGEVDLLRLLVPALCHLTVDEKARKILLDHKEEEVLYDALAFHWSIVLYKKPLVPKSERNKVPKVPEPKIPLKTLEKMKDSKLAMSSICNVLMNIIVLEPNLAEANQTFFTLSKFVFNNLPELKNEPCNLVLHGNLAVLGLLLLKSQAKRVKKDDFSICRFVQSTIRFLWDAYSVEESNDNATLVVSMEYKRLWNELVDLWFLGMQTLSSLLVTIPWISDFTIESGWAQGIVKMLKQVKEDGIPDNTKCGFEDFLCHLVDANKAAVKVLKDNNALTMCRNHRFMKLGKKLFGD